MKSVYSVDIREGFAHQEAFVRVNNEAFPEEERMEAEAIFQAAHEGIFEVRALYDGDDFIGFFALVVETPVVYIFFLAIDGTRRSKGYGAAALSLIRRSYPDHLIIVDIEKLDADAANTPQREKRKAFYCRNGYKETGYHLNYRGLVFEVLHHGAPFDEASFLHFFDGIEGKKHMPFLYRKRPDATPPTVGRPRDVAQDKNHLQQTKPLKDALWR